MADPGTHDQNPGDNGIREGFEQQLDSFLAGEWSKEQCRDFREGLTEQENKTLEAQLRIDDRLRSLFEIPDEGPALSLRPKTPWLMYTVAAAAAIVIAVGLQVFWPEPIPPYRGKSVYERYTRAIENGYEPDWVCETDEEFAAALDEHFEESFVLEPDPDLEIVGWNSSSYGSSGERARPIDLLLRVEGKPVVVVIARRRYNPKPESLTEGDLHTFKRRFGPLYLYEVSPFDNARALDLIRKP